MGYLNRFQGCLLPYTNTGTVQEINEISHPGQVISVQGTAIRSVRSSQGVYCDSKGGEADGHTQGYKDSPVPRRLVGVIQLEPKQVLDFVGYQTPDWWQSLQQKIQELLY